MTSAMPPRERTAFDGFGFVTTMQICHEYTSQLALFCNFTLLCRKGLEHVDALQLS